MIKHAVHYLSILLVNNAVSCGCFLIRKILPSEIKNSHAEHFCASSNNQSTGRILLSPKGLSLKSKISNQA